MHRPRQPVFCSSSTTKTLRYHAVSWLSKLCVPYCTKFNLCRWMVDATARQHQKLLLAALHSHCMHLLIQARELLPAGVCRLGQGSSSRGSYEGLDGCAGQMQQPVQQQPELQLRWQQQQLAWQVCCAQLQRNMLLVLHLIRGWQDWNADHGYQGLFEEYMKRCVACLMSGYESAHSDTPDHMGSSCKQT